MLNRFALLALLVLGQTAAQRASEKTPATFTNDTQIRVTSTLSDTALHTLSRIGIDNRLPLGIVLGGEPSLCSLHLHGDKSTMTINDFVIRIHENLPGYQASLENGALNIMPISLPANTASFLDLKIDNFQTIQDPVSLAGVALWMSLRRIIAPSQGTAFMSSTPVAATSIAPLHLQNKSVKSILNLLVTQKPGGVWILHGAEIKQLSPELKDPVEIYGYSGEETRIEEALFCH